MRIISLVPSLSELIFYLGLESSLVGRTRFCIHPESRIQNKPIVGGTKNPRLEKISDLSPDLIIANIEENSKEDIEELQKKFPVLLTDIQTIEDAILTILEIGKRCDEETRAKELIGQIHYEMEQIPDEEPLRVAYFIWRSPWMTVASGTYIHSVLSRWRLHNIFENRKRYPQVTLTEVAAKKPDLILLSSEPFPFKEKHKEEIIQSCPGSRVLLVDGEWFSWYGSRMLSSFKNLNIFRKAVG